MSPQMFQSAQSSKLMLMTARQYVLVCACFEAGLLVCCARVCCDLRSDGLNAGTQHSLVVWWALTHFMLRLPQMIHAHNVVTSGNLPRPCKSRLHSRFEQ
jgi:hypothetical protein